VAQEALNNIAKHAHAHRATIDLHTTAEAVELRIRDNGVGFDSVRTTLDHFGLRIMRERVASIGATLQIASQPGQGTEVSVTWCGGQMRSSP
jgi:two-component system sensor histidine kinase UhpB